MEAPEQRGLSARYDKIAKAWCCDIAKGQSVPVAISFKGPERPSSIAWAGLHDTVWLDVLEPREERLTALVSRHSGFRGVREEVWDFHVGGYQVCEKWLKDRKGRTLSKRRYRALSERSSSPSPRPFAS